AGNPGRTGSYAVSGSIFAQNKGINTSTNGGGILNASGAITITTSTFSSISGFSANQVTGCGGRGGALYNNSTGTMTVHYCRFVGNTAATASNGKTLFNNGGTVDANDNRWGANTGPGANDVVGTAVSTWLQLRHSAGPSTVCRSGVSTLTADIYGRNSGGPVANCPGASCGVNGLPAFPNPAGTIFSNAVLGSLSGAGTQFTNGQATATFTAGTTAGNGSADATADSS